MIDTRQLEDAWNEAGTRLWEAEAEEDRLTRLWNLAEEARKLAAWVCVFYAGRAFLAERTAKRARKANDRARDALHAAKAPDEVPASGEA